MQNLSLNLQSFSTVKSSDAPSEEDVDKWLMEGNVMQLENVLLNGRGHLLSDKTTTNEASNEFLRGIPRYQVNIDINSCLHVDNNKKISVSRIYIT